MPAEYYLDTIRVVFQQHLLPRGKWVVAGERVDPSKITGTALLTIEGELDDISGEGQTRAAHTLCTGVAEAHRAHITVDGAPRLLEVDNVVVCTGQESVRDLVDPLRAKGVTVHVIGGADVAAELDAKRAIRQGTELAASLD